MNHSPGNGLHFDLTCRFCLNGNLPDLISVSKPIDVYCSRNQAINLQHIVLTCIGISVCQDELPKWICKECVGQLTISYTFRQKCLETTKYLNDILIEREPVPTELKSLPPHLVTLGSGDCESKVQLSFEQSTSISNSDSDTEFQASEEKAIESNSPSVKDSSFDSLKWTSGHCHRIDNGPFKCDICDRVLKSRRTLVYHMRTLHIPNLANKTEVSEKRSDPAEPKPAGVNYLKRNVSVDNPLECEICRNGYPNRKSLSRHRIRVHGVFRSHKPIRSTEPKTKSKVKRWQICPICGVMRKDIKCHIATHESDRLFKCEICGSDLKTAVNLKRHLRRVHTEDRQYPCNLCNVAFKAPFQLKRHNRKHTQERNYACTYCEKRFIDKATLERHFVVHFRERNVECKFCAKRFQSNLGLQNHVGIHTLERKFKCGLCTLAFITSSAASVHRRTHRNKLDNHFHCGDCSMKFLEVIMLKMHLRAVSHRFSVEKN